jgi:hypothetical protein
MRMIIVGGLLMLALLGAVLSSVGNDHPRSASAPDVDNTPPEREITRQAIPSYLVRS